MKTKPYLDKRHLGTSTDKTATIKIAINHGGSSGYILTDVHVLPSEWDGARVVDNPRATALNVKIRNKWNDVELAIDELNRDGKLKGMNASAIARAITHHLASSDAPADLFFPHFWDFVGRKKEERTVRTYKTTERKINAFCQETKDRRTGRAIWSEDTLRFEDITVDWLRRFDAFLESTAPSPNARSIHMRNIRAVFRDAMRERATGAAYPFDGFRIEKRATKDRSVSVDDLRRLWSVSTDEHISWYLDYFKLSFLLCGANIADIAGLRTLHNGRAEFLRKKTGQPVSVLVQPEAVEIIERRAGRDGWLLDIHDRYKRTEDFLNRLNKALKKIGKVYNPHTKRWDGEAAFPELSYYCARYSWATIAAELDVPERTVGAALGHASSSVTSIYTRTDMRRKVDAANRRVIDLVLYDKLT